MNLLGIENSTTLRHICGHVTHATCILGDWGNGPWSVDDFRHWNFYICSNNKWNVALLIKDPSKKGKELNCKKKVEKCVNYN